MFSKLVCVSAVCLILALNGWEKEEIPNRDKMAYGDIDKLDDPDGDVWLIQLPEFMGCCHGDTSECHWWKFRSATCTESDDWQKIFAEFRPNFGFFEAVWALLKRIDQLPISNTVCSLVSCAPFLLCLIYNRLINKDWLSSYLSRVGLEPLVNIYDEADWPQDMVYSQGRDEDQQLLERHRVETELMAKTIEYVQRKKRSETRKQKPSGCRAPPTTLVPPDSLERDPLIHPGTVNNPSIKVPCADCSEEDLCQDADFNLSDCTEPDFEWD